MELCDLTAIEIAQKVRRKEISASEVLEATLKRIAAVDGRPGSLEAGTWTRPT